MNMKRWVGRLLDEAWQDLRFAVRALRATPVVTTVVILSLALGIGASTAIFSLVNGLLLRSLPVPDADRLVTLSVGNTSQRFTYATFEEIRRHDHLFDGALAWAESALTIGEEAEPAYVQWVSGDFFETLGVRAFVGRTFTAADDVAGGGPEGPVAVISHGLWQRRFGGASDAIGRSLLVEGVAVTVVGVAPPRIPWRAGGVGVRPAPARPDQRPHPAHDASDAPCALAAHPAQTATRAVDGRCHRRAARRAAADSIEVASPGAGGRRIPERAVRGRERRPGRVGPASTLRGSTGGPSRGGVAGAAGSLHERRQHPPGTRGRAPPRPEPAGRAGRLALAARSAVPHRERSAGPARRRPRHPVRRVGGPRDGRAAPERRSADRARPRCRPARVGIHGFRRGSRGHRCGVGAGTVGDDRPPPRRPEGGRAQRRRWRTGARVQRAAGGAGGGLGAAPGGRRPVRADVPAAHARAARIRRRPPPRGDRADADHAAGRPERGPTSPGAGRRVDPRGRRGRRLGPGAALLHLSGFPPQPVRRLPACGPRGLDAHGSDHPRVVRGVRHADAGGTAHRGAGRGRRPTGDGRQRRVRAAVRSRSERWWGRRSR